jgi:hypothetical protein
MQVVLKRIADHKSQIKKSDGDEAKCEEVLLEFTPNANNNPFRFTISRQQLSYANMIVEHVAIT